MKLLVIDSHTIFRHGLVTCLVSMPEVEQVRQAARTSDVSTHSGLLDVDVVILDPAADRGDGDFIGAAVQATGTSVVVCASECTDETILAAIEAGAVGYLAKEALTFESLGTAIRAAARRTALGQPQWTA